MKGQRSTLFQLTNTTRQSVTVYAKLFAAAVHETVSHVINIPNKNKFCCTMRVHRSSSYLLFWTLVFVPVAASSLTADGSMPDSLRGSPTTNKGRQHVIRRVYGPDNAMVRKNIAAVEERMERSRTGLNNPEHIIEYKNHPYDKTKRGLQTTQDSTFEPIRIFYETVALDSIRDGSNAAKIDFIKREILPRTSEFWQLALSVVPISGNLYISTSELDSRAYCGDSEFTEVPTKYISDGIADADLVLFVSGTPSSRFCSGTTLAVAVACNFDQFDRPTAGAVVRT